MTIEKILGMWTTLSVWAIAFSIIFPILAYKMACNKNQPIVRKGMITDLTYFFVMPIITVFGRISFLIAGSSLIFYGESQEEIAKHFVNGYGPFATLPLWLQIAMMFILSDFLLYWIHRFFHTGAAWKYHAIHHSSETVDWLSTYRFHPVNTFMAFAFVDALMLLIGFSPACLSALAVFNMLYSVMVHANLNWTFGPFKYVFASPVFHRWHHTSQQEGMDKNFAPTIPLFDVMFGTFYMPEGKLPQQYGVPGSDIPNDFIGQMIWPFKAK